MRIVGVHILHASVGAPKKRFARSLCGNVEWSLRTHAPPPAFVEVVGREQRGGIGLTPDLRLSDMGAPKRTLADGIESRLKGIPIDDRLTR